MPQPRADHADQSSSQTFAETVSPEMPQGSRRWISRLLRRLGSAMQTWADHLEAALIQVKATLPDSLVRQDLVARLWRIWLRFTTQLYTRLPQGWGEAIVTLLPIVLLLLGFLLWGLVSPSRITINPDAVTDFRTREERKEPAQETDLTLLQRNGLQRNGMQNVPMQNTGAIESELSSPPEPIDTIDSSEPDFQASPEKRSISAEQPTVSINGVNITNTFPLDTQPLGESSISVNLTRLDDSSTEDLADPRSLETDLESLLHKKLLQALKRSWHPILQSVSVDFAQGQMTVFVSPEWSALNSKEQLNLATTLVKRSKQLDFPRLSIVNSTGQTLARSAIVGEGVIFLF